MVHCVYVLLKCGTVRATRPWELTNGWLGTPENGRRKLVKSSITQPFVEMWYFHALGDVVH